MTHAMERAHYTIGCLLGAGEMGKVNALLARVCAPWPGDLRPHVTTIIATYKTRRELDEWAPAAKRLEAEARTRGNFSPALLDLLVDQQKEKG